MKKPLCPACTAILSERNRKGGSARSERKTRANRANAKLPRKKREKCPECGGTGGVDSGGVTPWGAGIMLPCPACHNTPKPKQNARQSRFRPKVGQVWTLDGGAIEWTISSITMDNVISRYDINGIGIGSSAYDKEQWLADRKAGVIRIVRGRK